MLHGNPITKPNEASPAAQMAQAAPQTEDVGTLTGARLDHRDCDRASTS